MAAAYLDKAKVKMGVVQGFWMEEYAKASGYTYNSSSTAAGAGEYYYITDPLANYESNPDTNVNNYVITKGSTYNYVSDYIGIGGKLVIPSTGNTEAETMAPVYSVAKGAIKTVLDRLYAVEVSEGIVAIEESAFANATELKSVTLPTP